MQIVEKEMVISLRYHTRLKALCIQMSVIFLLSMGICAYLILMTLRNQSLYPQGRDNSLIIFSAIMTFFIFMIQILNFLFLRRRMRDPAPYLRINQEGIFTSHDSLLIKWAEIKELSLSTLMGTPYLRIGLWNLDEVAARAKTSSKAFVRWNFALAQLFFRHAKSPTPLGITQRALPIPVNELLNAIQAQFTAELYEHRISVQRE